MPGSQHTDAPVYTGTRLPAIDTMRGIVMVLMAMDHASHVFNAGRYVRDSFRWYPPGSEIPAAQFLTRWVTHLCAPTFLFLAGLVLALSVAKRQALGDPERSIDGDIIKRGVFILLLDPLWMSFGFGEGIVLQVLYAIGVSLCCMAFLRRLGVRGLFAIGLGILFFGEGLVELAVWGRWRSKIRTAGHFSYHRRGGYKRYLCSLSSDSLAGLYDFRMGLRKTDAGSGHFKSGSLLYNGRSHISDRLFYGSRF